MSPRKHDVPDELLSRLLANAETWDEKAIFARGASLAQAMIAIWPDVARERAAEAEPA
jgi:hypothetical protein